MKVESRHLIHLQITYTNSSVSVILVQRIAIYVYLVRLVLLQDVLILHGSLNLNNALGSFTVGCVRWARWLSRYDILLVASDGTGSDDVLNGFILEIIIWMAHLAD